MLNKQNLPAVSRRVLILLAVISSFVFISSLGDSSTPPGERMLGIVTLAVPSALVLAALIGAGGWVDRTLAAIQPRPKRTMYTLLAYLAIPMVCAAGAGVLSLLFSTGFGDTWGKDASFGIAFLLTLAAIPLAFGTVFIYLGAIVSAFARWLAGRLWPEAEQDSPA